MTSIQTHSISGSALLIELSISTWSGRKFDKDATTELTHNKSASSKAARVNKHLLADEPQLEAIAKQASSMRTSLYQFSLPWSDSGLRLVPTQAFFPLKQELDKQIAIFDNMVTKFINDYPTLISTQAFKLGQMFDRADYPTAEQIRDKFRARYIVSPVPDRGDFRVDIGETMREELELAYSEAFEQRVAQASRDMWDRLHEVLARMSDRLTIDDDKPRVFRDTLINNAIELCEMLRTLNVTQDKNLELARSELVGALRGVDAQTLRESPIVRELTKDKVDAILNKFNF